MRGREDSDRTDGRAVAASGSTPLGRLDDEPTGTRRHPDLPELTRGELRATHESELLAAVRVLGLDSQVRNRHGQVDFRLVHRRFASLLEAWVRSWRPRLPEATVQRIVRPFRTARTNKKPAQRDALRRFDTESQRHRAAHPFGARAEILRFDRKREGRFGDLCALETMVRRRLEYRLDKRSAWSLPEIVQGHRGYGADTIQRFIDGVPASQFVPWTGRSRRAIPGATDRSAKEEMIRADLATHPNHGFPRPRPYLIARELRKRKGKAAPSGRFASRFTQPKKRA